MPGRRIRKWARSPGRSWSSWNPLRRRFQRSNACWEHSSKPLQPCNLFKSEWAEKERETRCSAVKEVGSFEVKARCYLLALWSAQRSEYQEVEVMRIPTRIEIMWHLASGEFTWFRVKITEIEYNQSGEVIRFLGKA